MLAINHPPETIYSFKGTQTEIHSLNFILSSVEEKLISGTRNGDVFVWDLESLNFSHSFKSGNGPCISLLVPDDGQILVTHTRGDAIRKWNRRTDGTMEETGHIFSSSLQYCSAQLVDFANVREKMIVFASGEEKAVHVAEVAGHKIVSNLSYSDKVGSIMGLTNIGKGKVMAIFEAGDLVLWDLRMTQPLKTFKLVILLYFNLNKNFLNNMYCRIYKS
jgi:WD40 repeat protein